MSTAKKLIERNHRTIEVDGLPYVVYKMSALIGLEVIGPGVLMNVVEHQDSPPELAQAQKSKAAAEGMELIRSVLRRVMINPRLGEHDDPENDIVSWYTLGDTATKLYNKLLQEDQTNTANFPESSVAPKG